MSVKIEVDTKEAETMLRELPGKIDMGTAEALIRAGEIFAGAMEDEAPRGATGGLARSVRAQKVGDDTVEVQPHKRTNEGWKLHHAIVGNPRVPRYTNRPPPLLPLMFWAAAVLGDPGAAYGIRWAIFRRGHATFPNPFVDRAFNREQARATREAESIMESIIE